MHPEDFSDVFGGPPRSVLSRQYSGDFTAKARSNSFYEEIFRPADLGAPARSGRVLPVFRIPGNRKGGGGFYSDIFGSDDDRRSRTRSKPNSKSKSKSNSSSVLSSEELSPLRPVIGDDVALSSFASKLRPINVPSRWSSSMMMPEEYSRKQGMPAFPCNPSPYVENHFMKTEYDDDSSSIFGFSQRVSFPETITVEPNSYGSIKVSIDDLELNSPSSAVSSVCQAPEAKPRIPDDELLQGQETEQEDDDEVMSSYVIEITPDRREGTDEADALDEAIAWAKEKFQTHSSEKEWSIRPHETEHFVEMEDRPNSHEFRVPQMDEHGMMQSPR
ncbi:hypothetical protein AAG906_028386 [Vitis piasezkii]